MVEKMEKQDMSSLSTVLPAMHLDGRLEPPTCKAAGECTSPMPPYTAQCTAWCSVRMDCSQSSVHNSTFRHKGNCGGVYKSGL